MFAEEPLVISEEIDTQMDSSDSSHEENSAKMDSSNSSHEENSANEIDQGKMEFPISDRIVLILEKGKFSAPDIKLSFKKNDGDCKFLYLYYKDLVQIFNKHEQVLSYLNIVEQAFLSDASETVMTIKLSDKRELKLHIFASKPVITIVTYDQNKIQLEALGITLQHSDYVELISQKKSILAGYQIMKKLQTKSVQNKNTTPQFRYVLSDKNNGQLIQFGETWSFDKNWAFSNGEANRESDNAEIHIQTKVVDTPSLSDIRLTACAILKRKHDLKPCIACIEDLSAIEHCYPNRCRDPDTLVADPYLCSSLIFKMLQKINQSELFSTLHTLKPLSTSEYRKIHSVAIYPNGDKENLPSNCLIQLAELCSKNMI